MFNVSRWLVAILAALQLQYAAVSADDKPISLCGKFDAYNSTNKAQPYLWIPNAWGDDGSGGSCLNVTDNGAAWSLTYKWTGTPTLVKQYAHMKAWPSNTPMRLKDVSHLELKGIWSTVVDGTQNANAADQALALHLNGIWSNVAVDMFLSPDPKNATGANPPIEIMIWPWYSVWVRPLGWAETDPNLHVVPIDGVNFTLYHGFNDGGQHVFSWLAKTNMTSTNADYGPLLKYIWQKGLLSGDLWVGQLEVGTEVLHAASKTIFSMKDYKLQLIQQGAANDYTTTSSTRTASATLAPTANSTRTSPAVNTASTTPTSTSGAGSVRIADAQRGLSNIMFALMAVTMISYITQLIDL